MHINESILDKIDNRDFNKSSAEKLSSSGFQEEPGRYLFEFTVYIKRDRDSETTAFIINEIIQKIEYYLNSFRFIRNVGPILFYEYNDTIMEPDQLSHINVPDIHPNLYVDKNTTYPNIAYHFDIEIFFDADFKSGREIYQFYRRFFLPVSYFKILTRNKHYLCYTDNQQGTLLKDTKTGKDKTIVYFPDDVNWSWFSCWESLTDMCKCYLNKPDYTAYDVLRDIRYNNIDAILMNEFYKEHSCRENDTLKLMLDGTDFGRVKVIGHYDHINPAQAIYDWEKQYIDKKQTPVAGYSQQFDVNGDSLSSFSSPWSPTARHAEHLRHFCENTPFTVYLLWLISDYDYEKKRVALFLYDSYYQDPNGKQSLIGLVSGLGSLGVSAERALTCVMSPEEALKICKEFLPDEDEDNDEDDEDDELYESLLDDLTTDDTESAVQNIATAQNNKRERQHYYRNTIRIITGAQIMPMDMLVQEPDRLFGMYEGNAFSIERTREIFESIKRVNARLDDFLDACPFIKQYSITFNQGDAKHSRDLITGYIGDAIFTYAKDNNNTQTRVDVAFNNDDLRGPEAWRFVKALYACVGNDDDKMNHKEFYPSSMTLRKGPFSDFYNNLFYGMYLKDESTDKMKYMPFATFCLHLCGKDKKPFDAYLRHAKQRLDFAKTILRDIFSNQLAKNTLCVENASKEGLMENFGMTFDDIYLYDPSWDVNTIFIQGIVSMEHPNHSHDDLPKEKLTEQLWQWIQQERPDYMLHVQTSKEFVNVQLMFYGTSLKAYETEYYPVIRQRYSRFNNNMMLARCLRIISFASGRSVEDIINDKEIFPKSVINGFKKLKSGGLDQVITDAKEKDFTTYDKI